MKNFLKYIGFVMSMCAISADITAGSTFTGKNDVLNAMDNAFNRTFGTSDLFISYIDFVPLESFIKNLDPYITEKASVKILGLDKEIWGEYTNIKGRMNDMVNGIKVLHRGFALKPQKTAQDIKKMNELGAQFSKIGDTLQSYLSKIDKIRSKLILSDKKEAMDIVRAFCAQLKEQAYSVGVEFETFMLEVETL